MPSVPSAELLNAREFSGTERFQLIRQLGMGGMGVVYEALDRETGEKVALKTLRNVDGTAILLFKQEFRALAGIASPEPRSGSASCSSRAATGSSRWSCSRASHLMSWLRDGDNDAAARRRSRSSSPGSARCTTPVTCTATSSRRTCSSPKGRVVLLDFGLATRHDRDQLSWRDGDDGRHARRTWRPSRRACGRSGPRRTSTRSA